MLDVATKTTGAGQPANARDVREIVRDHHQLSGVYGPEVGWFPAEIADDLQKRLDLGEAKYGYSLKIGWDGATTELYQELLDAVLYAISAQNWAVVPHLTNLLLHMRK